MGSLQTQSTSFFGVSIINLQKYFIDASCIITDNYQKPTNNVHKFRTHFYIILSFCVKHPRFYIKVHTHTRVVIKKSKNNAHENSKLNQNFMVVYRKHVVKS